MLAVKTAERLKIHKFKFHYTLKLNVKYGLIFLEPLLNKTSDIQMDGPLRQNDSPQLISRVSQKYGLSRNPTCYG